MKPQRGYRATDAAFGGNAQLATILIFHLQLVVPVAQQFNTPAASPFLPHHTP
ncbi:MAG: hypothetical protein LBD87_04245 [Prevotellaceae bacterium]|nr:hypothetical protein [Prevotellaceae bacterium]